MDLKQKIRNEYSVRKDSDHIVKLSGYANTSALNKALDNKDGKIKFKGLIDVVKHMYPQKYKDYLYKYFKSVDPCLYVARFSLEFASINRYDDLLKFQIDRLVSCGNTESQQWGKLYNIIYSLTQNLMTPEDALDAIQDTTISKTETKAFSYILQFYCYYYLRLVDPMIKLAEIATKAIAKISNDYLRKSYETRLALMMADIHLHKNEVSKVRQYVSAIVGDCDHATIKSLLYLQLGNSYLFESYSTSYGYLEKARITAEENSYLNGITQASRSLNFLNNYWNKEALYLDYKSEEISDIHEVAFSHINNGKNGDAIEILEKVEFEKLSMNQKGFHFYLRGLATEEKIYYCKSIKAFIEAGEKFYKTAPIIELKKMGADEMFLEMVLG
jgi:hypothetical protein